VRNEAETLSRAGYRVTAVAPRGRDQSPHEQIGGVDVRRFWLPETPQTSRGFLLEYSVAHAQLARHAVRLLAQGVDALHLCNPPDTLAPLLVLARIFGRRAVFDNHDLFPELFEVRYGSRRTTVLLRMFQRLAFRAPNLVLTTNESQRALVLARTQRTSDTVVVVRNGPRQSSVSMVDSVDLQSQDAVTLLFVGALAPQDGVVTLADVLDRLVRKHRLNARLIVVGAGSCADQLRSECERYGLGEAVTFTGRVPPDEVPVWLSRADVCVDPAPCNELNHSSTMIKIAEYLAAGKPVVAFDLRETRRTAGDAALYAPCGDVDRFAAIIAELARNPQLRRELVSRGRERLPELLWEESADALLGAYRRLLA
jgi:glycosyltransferase involved in cell wall biosynthesis